MLDWKPRFTLDEGLRRTIAWYSDFLGYEEKLAA
jgi:nucleoside-diphosphate-sugar epimerase